MRKKYRKFKKWAEQKKVQEILNYLIASWIGGIVVVTFVLFHSQISMVAGIAANRILGVTPTTIPLLTPIPTLTPAGIQIPTATPTENKEVYIDPDPVIECQNPNCGSINIKKSLCSNTVGYACCQVGSTWTWYASRDKCSQDQANYIQNQVSKNTSQGNNEPNITCVLNWGTYQLPKSVCDGYKNSPQITPYASNYVPYPTSPPAPVVDHQKLQQACVDQENKTYSDLLFEYKRQWGHDPTTDLMAKQHGLNLASCYNL